MTREKGGTWTNTASVPENRWPVQEQSGLGTLGAQQLHVGWEAACCHGQEDRQRALGVGVRPRQLRLLLSPCCIFRQYSSYSNSGLFS